MEAAKKSFVSAGYSQQEVDSAAQKVSAAGVTPVQKTIKPVVAKTGVPVSKPQLPVKKEAPTQATPVAEKKFFTKKKIIVFSIVAVSIIILALVAGLLWNTLF